MSNLQILILIPKPSSINPISSILTTRSSHNNAKSFKNLSPDEVKELQAKNLCFYCRQPFSSDHACAQTHKMQLQLIELEEQSGEEGEDDTRQDLEVLEKFEGIPEQSKCLQICLHAIQ